MYKRQIESQKHEIKKLKDPIGKQDQYISVYGGISEFQINRKGFVNVKNPSLSRSVNLYPSRIMTECTVHHGIILLILSRYFTNPQTIIDRLHIFLS